MKEFTSAVESIEEADEREAKIVALMEDAENPRTREEAEREVDLGKPVEFKIDGRKMKAYPPADGQLAFMVATLGRGQSSDQRFAGIINLMTETLLPADKDYFEKRLLTNDRKHRLPMSTLEGVFEHLTEEWFRDKSSEGGSTL